jgi:acetyl-CoA C-acetyltransferase
MAALLAGFPVTVPGITVNRNCASALDAVNEAAKAVLIGEGGVFIGGGVESMSRAPWSMPKFGTVPTTSVPTIYDTTVGWRYPNPRLAALYPIISLGETAEAIAAELHITREQQDKFALESHRRAVAAMNAGTFAAEIIPVEAAGHAGATQVIDVDEHPRCTVSNGRYALATDLASLAKLKPAFKSGGTVTAGNSSGMNDGAAAMLVMSRTKADALGLEPLARWVGSAAAGVDPGLMGYGPVPATQKLLKRLKLTLEDIDLIELNEAFAAQVIACDRELGFDAERLNVNGGAIALGHPIGCTGVRITTTLVHEMEKREAKLGLATLCVSGGMGLALLLERV